MTDASQPEQRFEIDVSPETETGVYADFVSIWHTPDTFVLDFAALRRPPYITEDSETGAQLAMLPTRIVTRVKIPPSQVFEIMKALEQQLTSWENETGRRPPSGGPGPPPPGSAQ